MTLLRDVRPDDVVRAGAVFGQVAEQVAGTVSRCRASATVQWNGPPVLQYQRHLGDLVGDLGKIQAAYDAACDALLSYARVLVVVRDLALQADLLEAQAEDLRLGRDISSDMGVFFSPMTPAESAVRQRAAMVRAEAQEREVTASSRVAVCLRDLAARAPRRGGWVSAGRFASHFALRTGDVA